MELDLPLQLSPDQCAKNPNFVALLRVLRNTHIVGSGLGRRLDEGLIEVGDGVCV